MYWPMYCRIYIHRIHRMYSRRGLQVEIAVILKQISCEQHQYSTYMAFTRVLPVWPLLHINHCTYTQAEM